MDKCKFKNVWDKFYSEEGGYLESPDNILIELIHREKIHKAIDVGAGNGRHAIYLASNEIKVKAIDVSSNGLSKIKSWTSNNNLPVETVVISAIDYSFEEGIYDLAISTGSALNFFKKGDSIKVIRGLQNSVKVGGFIYLTLSTIYDSAFLKHFRKASKVDGNTFYSKDMGVWMTAYKDNELRELFDKFEVLEYKEEDILDNGHGEPHYHHTAVILARRVI